jgi:hypothetical protein
MHTIALFSLRNPERKVNNFFAGAKKARKTISALVSIGICGKLRQEKN